MKSYILWYVEPMSQGRLYCVLFVSCRFVILIGNHFGSRAKPLFYFHNFLDLAGLVLYFYFLANGLRTVPMNKESCLKI